MTKGPIGSITRYEGNFVTHTLEASVCLVCHFDWVLSVYSAKVYGLRRGAVGSSLAQMSRPSVEFPERGSDEKSKN